MNAATTRIDGIERRIVSAEDWRRARESMTEQEKAHMRALDRLAAERRHMPWTKMAAGYSFEGPRGRVSLADLFAGRKQLILYHFMFGPQVDGWPDAGCVGCSFVADQVCHLDHLHARDIEFAFVSAAPLENLERYRQRMGWKVPWYSGSEEFNRTCDVSKESGNSFGLSVFYRDGEDVYRTYFATRRGIEAFGTAWSFYDITPFGRQEEWQEAPEGTPQGKPYVWWRRHGEYEGQPAARGANAAIWFEIYAQDIARARAFYESVLRTTLEPLQAPFPGIELWAFPMAQDRYGAGGALVKMEGFEPDGSSSIVYFACDDCAVEASRAASAGGRIERPKMPLGEYGFMSHVRDTEGNLIGLHSMK